MATREELQQAMVAAHRAGDTANARKLAQALAAMPATNAPPPKPVGLGGLAMGVLDVMGAGMRGTINNAAQTARGLQGAGKGMLSPDITARQGYQAGKAEEAANQQAATDRGTNPFPNVGIQTPGGQRVAQWISNLPIGMAAQGGPNAGQIPRLGPTVEALGESIGGGIENNLGPEARDVARDAFALLSLKGGAPKPTGTAAAAIGRASRAGYITPPTAALSTEIGLMDRANSVVTGTPPTGAPRYAGSTADRVARNFGGAADVDARIAMRNQQVTQRLAAEAAKLPEMTPQAHARSMAEANGAYDAIKKLTGPGGAPLHVPLNSQNYYQRVLSLAKTPGWQSMARLPDAIETLKHDLLTVHPTVEGVVNRVRQLREDAFKNFDGDAEAQMVGRAQREAADILDDELRDRLQFVATTSTNPNFKSIASRVFDEYTQARQQLSILHDIRSAMNPSTGTIDASKLARLAQQGRRIAPQLDEIANAHQAYGGVGMQTAEKAAKTAGSPLGTGDILSGAFVGSTAGGMSGSATNAIMGGAIGALVVPFSRYASREFALRGPAVRAATKAGSGVLRVGTAGAAIGNEIEDGQ